MLLKFPQLLTSDQQKSKILHKHELAINIKFEKPFSTDLKSISEIFYVKSISNSSSYGIAVGRKKKFFEEYQ